MADDRADGIWHAEDLALTASLVKDLFAALRWEADTGDSPCELATVNCSLSTV